MRRAVVDAFVKLDPRHQIRNPVMFVVAGRQRRSRRCCSSRRWSPAAARRRRLHRSASRLWLWFTVLFANFAEAMAEGRGKAQADTLRKARRDVTAKKLARAAPRRRRDDRVRLGTLRKGDVVLVEAGDVIPGDGEVDRGRRLGRRERDHRRKRAGHPRERRRPQRVTGGTRVLSDWLVVRITANPGETFLDRMIALVEGAKRQKTPNEIALDILLAALTIIFLLAMRHAAAVLALQRASGRAGHARSPSPCWSRCWSA